MSGYEERLEIRLDPERYSRLRREAQERGVSMAWIVREALDRYYVSGDKEEAKRRQQAMERLFSTDAPVEDWPTMKEEIEKGFLRHDPRLY